MKSPLVWQSDRWSPLTLTALPPSHAGAEKVALDLMRGEVRGGRFIEGLSGEQFALPEAIAPLRKARQKPQDGTLVCVSALDPLNLSGTVVVGEKVPRIAGARVLYRDGMPVASLVAGEVAFMPGLPPGEQAAARRSLLREPASGVDALMAQLHAGVASTP